MKHPPILLIESSGEVCSLALIQDGKLIGERNHFELNSHSKVIAALSRELLEECKVEPDMLAAVAVSEGPGSYTGLRIGCSFAKGLCFSLNIPLITVNSLNVIAHAIKEQNIEADFICPLIDARRNDCYYALYNTNLDTKEAPGFVTLDSGFLNQYSAKHKIVCGGSGSNKLKDIVNSTNLIYTEITALAKHMLKEVVNKYAMSAFESVAYFEPNYIKSVHITATKKTHFN